MPAEPIDKRVEQGEGVRASLGRMKRPGYGGDVLVNEFRGGNQDKARCELFHRREIPLLRLDEAKMTLEVPTSSCRVTQLSLMKSLDVGGE